MSESNRAEKPAVSREAGAGAPAGDAAGPGTAVTPEAPASGPAPEREGGEVTAEALLERSRALEAALAEERDRALRLQAEMENLRKRAERDVENAHKFGTERLVSELLPVKDSLELGLQAASAAEGVAGIREGAALTLKLLSAALEKFGVEELDPIAKPFDPEFHQAMVTRPAEGIESGTVLEVFQKGYTLSGRLVRPAMVIVAE